MGTLVCSSQKLCKVSFVPLLGASPPLSSLLLDLLFRAMPPLLFQLFVSLPPLAFRLLVLMHWALPLLTVQGFV